MTDLAKLVVRLEAETARYQKELEKSRGQLRKFDKQAVESAKRIARDTAQAAAAAAAAFGAIVNSQIRVQDEAGKTADRLGLTTEELTKLRFAAKITGVEQNTLEMALQRMTRRLAEAAQGSGEAAGAIDQLGLDAKALAEAGPDAAIKEIAEALKGVPSQAERVRLAFKFFDSEGVALVNTLKLGRGGIEELGREAEDLGIVIDSKTAAAAARFNDNVTRLTSSASGFAQQLASRLLPTLEGLTDEMVDAANESGGLDQSLDGVETVLRGTAAGAIVAGSAIANLVRAIASLVAATNEIDIRATDFLFGGIPRVVARNREVIARQVDLMGDVFGDLQGNFADALMQAEKVLNDGFARIRETTEKGTGGRGSITIPDEDISKQTNQIESLVSGLEQQIATFEKGAVATARYRAEQGDLADSFDAMGARGAQLKETYIALTAELQRMEEASKAAEERQQYMNELQSRAQQVYEDTRTPLEQYQAELTDLNELIARGMINQETYNRAVENAQESFEKATKSGKDWAEQMEAFSKSAARNIQSAFADFLFDPFEDGLSGMLKSFAQTLQRMAAEAAAAQILNSVTGGGGLEGAIGGLLGSAAGLFGGGSGAVAAGQSVAAAGPISARANGGPVNAGSPYLVGERGPELFVPSTSGEVVSNRDLRREGGETQNVTQIFNVQTPDANSFRRSERQIMRSARQKLSL